MRKTLILTLVLCVFAVIAYAQTGAAPATSGTSTTTSTTTSSATGAGTTTTTTKSTHKKAVHCTFKGTVTVVGDNTFTVKPAKGDDVVLKVNEKTKYSPAGKTWADVKVDAKVSGTCKKDGADTWAVSVKFAAEKKMKAKAEPAAAPKTGK